MSEYSKVKLSICIPTFNRAAFIRETLTSIIVQATSDCEIVVSDNGSTDDTQEVVLEYARSFDRLRYFRQEVNVGIDSNYDLVMQLGRGEYCWLLSDDDLLKPGAVATVLEALHGDVSAVLVNYERRDISMEKVLLARFLDMQSDRVYTPDEFDRLVAEVGCLAIYGGSIVIKRAIWCGRDKERYYGSLWIHLGVVFQDPLPGNVLAIATPLISYREGNARSYSSDFFETVTVKLPSVVSTIPASESSKSSICSKEPWRSARTLFFYRATGYYTPKEFRHVLLPRLRSVRDVATFAMVAWFPGQIVNLLCVLYYSIVRHRFARLMLASLKRSPFYIGNVLCRRGRSQDGKSCSSP